MKKEYIEPQAEYVLAQEEIICAETNSGSYSENTGTIIDPLD